MVLVAYRHGLRASELVDLRWEQVAFKTATLHVRRVNQGTPSTHPILGDELRTLPGGGMAKSTKVHFTCPNCSALYQVVKAEAGPETTDDPKVMCVRRFRPAKTNGSSNIFCCGRRAAARFGSASCLRQCFSEAGIFLQLLCASHGGELRQAARVATRKVARRRD
jgi:hypothetical protein